MKKQGNYCPRCGSPDIGWVLPQIWSKWHCRKCDYEGALIIEDGELAEKIRERFLDNNKQ